jgi:lipopolysaccharide transport system ATP-binding protein
MLSNENAIEIGSLGKCYKIYKKPKDKLKEIVLPWKSRYYEEFWALKNISFEIKKGEQLSIIGRNGSGKSTLLQLICGTIEATEGTIKKQGKIAALLELGSGFNPEFTGIENIYLNAAIFGISRKQIEQKLDLILSFADIGEFVHQKVKTYSSGMQVRLAFAVIAHLEAEIMICDEALAVGDAVFTQKCMRFINKFKENGTLIFVSHDMASVAAITEKCLWLKDGRVEYLGNTKKAIQLYDRYCQEQGGYLKQYNSEENMNEAKRIKQNNLEDNEEITKVQEAINYSKALLKSKSNTKILAKMEQKQRDGHFDG